MNKKINFTLFSLFIVLSVLVGCTKLDTTLTNTVNNQQTQAKVTIVTTLFPQYDFVRQIVGDKAQVSMLLAPGVESHSYDPTPADIIKINNADLFIYSGEYMESWAKRIIDGLDDKSVEIIDISEDITLSKPDDEDHEAEEYHDDVDTHDDEDIHENEDPDHSHTFDPHIWTDPNNAMIIVDRIAQEICEVDPANAAFYRENATAYKQQLSQLDQEIRFVVENSPHKKIIFGGRNAFHYFLKQYGLSYEGAYEGCSSEADPSVKVVASLIDLVKKEQYPVIFYEELSTPKVAQSISEETGAQMLLLHSAHNVSKDDFNQGVTYLSIMKQNLENLKIGLS